MVLPLWYTMPPMPSRNVSVCVSVCLWRYRPLHRGRVGGTSVCVRAHIARSALPSVLLRFLAYSQRIAVCKSIGAVVCAPMDDEFVVGCLVVAECREA